VVAGATAGAGRCFGWQPPAKVSMMIMRPPQQRHGRGSTRGSSAAVVADVDARESRPVGTPSTLTKAPAGRQSAPLSGFPRGSTGGRLASRRRCQRTSRAAQRRHLRRDRNSRRVIRSLIRSAENSASCRKRICPLPSRIIHLPFASRSGHHTPICAFSCPRVGSESAVFNEEAVVLRKRSLTATLHRVRAMG
jgi:hypothetical protein